MIVITIVITTIITIIPIIRRITIISTLWTVRVAAA